MEIHVFAAVLLAAFMHAAWNSAFKMDLDRVSVVFLLAIMQAVIAGAVLPFAEQPTRESWPWILYGAVCHIGYLLFLLKSYAYNDLSRAYPLARGTAPLIVAVFSAVVLNVSLNNFEIVAVLAISGGVLIMAFLGTEHGRMGGRALFYAFGTAVFTACYTLIDGIGARIAQSATGYILWLILINSTGIFIYAMLTKGPRFLATLMPHMKVGIFAGATSLGSYWIAVWAFTQAPLTLVASLRESSILFAILIARFFLGEKINSWRWISALLIMGGIVLMRF